MNKQEFYKNIQKIETAYNKKFSKEEQKFKNLNTK